MNKKEIKELERMGWRRCFRNPLKISYRDSQEGFGGKRVADFRCDIRTLAKHAATMFWISGTADPIDNDSNGMVIDTCDYVAIFPEIMTREKATSLCREFMRTIPTKGLYLNDFVKFFKDRGAKKWLLGFLKDRSSELGLKLGVDVFGDYHTFSYEYI